MEDECKEAEAAGEGEVGGAEGLSFVLQVIAFLGSSLGEGGEAF